MTGGFFWHACRSVTGLDRRKTENAERGEREPDTSSQQGGGLPELPVALQEFVKMQENAA